MLKYFLRIYCVENTFFQAFIFFLMMTMKFDCQGRDISFSTYPFCMIGITLPTNPEARYDYQLKRDAISRFMFNMAFENSIEDGYVTEKPFDALISGQ